MIGPLRRTKRARSPPRKMVDRRHAALMEKFAHLCKPQSRKSRPSATIEQASNRWRAVGPSPRRSAARLRTVTPIDRPSFLPRQHRIRCPPCRVVGGFRPTHTAPEKTLELPTEKKSRRKEFSSLILGPLTRFHNRRSPQACAPRGVKSWVAALKRHKTPRPLTRYLMRTMP